jgi:hypothetical protein
MPESRRQAATTPRAVAELLGGCLAAAVQKALDVDCVPGCFLADSPQSAGRRPSCLFLLRASPTCVTVVVCTPQDVRPQPTSEDRSCRAYASADQSIAPNEGRIAEGSEDKHAEENPSEENRERA